VLGQMATQVFGIGEALATLWADVRLCCFRSLATMLAVHVSKSVRKRGTGFSLHGLVLVLKVLAAFVAFAFGVGGSGLAIAL
jgi:hypothetical protein